MKSASFFIAGGTVPRDAPSYVPRPADIELLNGLRAGEFCYVLTSRQMGKSSLMVRAMSRLKSEGTTVAHIDLTAIGQNLTVEQWYDGLQNLLARSLDLEQELEDHWLSSDRFSPLQRWMQALRDVVLEQVPGNVVIFVDEIDAVRSLPFSADEFFSAIRECFNRRAHDPAYYRLTFCLLGVATPSDLIQDVRTTPFNIGKRIELTDFTEAEAELLAPGLGGVASDGPAEPARLALLRRILYWTGGHPYLTQRLCMAVSDGISANNYPAGPERVDLICRANFLSEAARETDDNLNFVRDRILRGEHDIGAILNVYSDVLRRRRVASRETDERANSLQLSGIVKSEHGALKVRNRIYERVFNTDWVYRSMPNAELLRLRAAAHRATVRAAALASVVVGMMGILAFAAWSSSRRAESKAVESANHAEAEATNARIAREQANAARTLAGKLSTALAARDVALKERGSALNEARHSALEAKHAAKLAETRRITAAELAGQRKAALASADRALYIADMNVIPRIYESGNVGKVLDLLSETRRSPERGFEWGYWNRMCHLEQQLLRGHKSDVSSALFSPDGSKIITAGADKTVRVWDAANGKLLRTLVGSRDRVNAACFSHDGERAYAAGADGAIREWSVETGALLYTLEDAHPGGVNSVQFSPGGQTFVTAGADGLAKIWNADCRLICSIRSQSDTINGATYSPDGGRILTANGDDTASVWDAATGKLLTKTDRMAGGVMSACFSPDGSHILTANWDRCARVFSASNGTLQQTIRGHFDAVYAAEFSPNGRRIATACSDNIVRLWDAQTGALIEAIKGHVDCVNSIAFSPDGSRFVTASADSTARVWNAANRTEGQVLRGPTRRVERAAFSRDGSRVVTACDDGTAHIWDVRLGKEILKLRGHSSAVLSASFSYDGSRVVTAGADNTARIWNAATGKEIGKLVGHKQQVNSAEFSPDDRRIVTSSNDRTAIVWDAATYRPLTIFKGHSNLVNSAVFSSDGARVVTSSFDRTARIWNPKTGAEIRRLEGHTSWVVFAEFSPTGDRIVTTGRDKVARIWDAQTGRQLMVLRGHFDEVSNADFSADGSRIVTSSWDKTARVWETRTGQELLNLTGHLDAINSARFSADGSRIVTAGLDFTAIVWDSRTSTVPAPAARFHRTLLSSNAHHH